MSALPRVSAAAQKILVYFHYPELINLERNGATLSDGVHLQRALEWLACAQDSSDSGGIPSSFDLLKRSWGPLYRETTGYIIPTFLNYARLYGEKTYRERAMRMGAWELAEQGEDGSIGEKNRTGRTEPKIFNTSQVMLGFCALFDETSEKTYLDAAVRGADWLCANQETSGAWEQYSNDGAKTYDSRVAWALLEVWKRTEQNEYREAALRGIGWVTAEQHDNGWFENCSLRDPLRPWTHTIAYTISGLLECALCLNDARLMEQAIKPARMMLEYLASHDSSHLPGTFDPEWKSSDRYSCLTGDAQMAGIWLKIHRATGEGIYRKEAMRILEGLKRVQLRSRHRELDGAIAGSYPLRGDYAAYALPNWSTKFFADALLIAQTSDTPLVS